VSAVKLQQIFRTLGDPTRARILFLLEREELAVQELMEVLNMAQSRVSRHLGLLRGAGLLRDRRDGAFSLYRFREPAAEAWRAAWALARRELAADPASARDLAALARVLQARRSRSRSFFDSVGAEWDSLRKAWGDELLRARAMGRLVPPGLRVADVGAGSGVLARELAEAGCQVVAVDHSRAMLEAARRKLELAGVAGVEFRLGDASALPLGDGEVDAALGHMVLQYLSSPAEALAEMARVVRPGGRVIAVDFVAHDREWMRRELGVQRMGFAPEQVADWLRAAGLGEVRAFVQPGAVRGADLPETFLAQGVAP